MRQVIPPFGFALFACAPGDDAQCLYRGGFPASSDNQAFLSSLGLKTIISLTPSYPDKLEAFTQAHSIRVEHVPTKKVKDGSLPFSSAVMRTVVARLLEKDIYPVYIHDLDGSDALSLVLAALRKVQGYTAKSYETEMCRYLREPPAESDHVTFLNRFVSTSNSRETEELVVPSAANRVQWLWPSSLFTNTNSSSSMSRKLKLRLKILEDPKSGNERVPPTEPSKTTSGRATPSETMREHNGTALSTSPERASESELRGSPTAEEERPFDEDEDDDVDDEDIIPLSQTIEALDLGL